MTTVSKTYLDERHLTSKSFVLFLTNNKPLLFISIATIFIVFGVKLTNICFGIDSELHIVSARYLNWMEIGRFGLVGLQKIWTNSLPNQELFNPCLAVFFGCTFLLFGSLLWCFVIDLFSNNSIKKICYIPFAVLFISHQVWVEQIYFVCQSAECLFIVLLSPVSVYLLFKGTCTGSLRKIISGLILAVFCVSVYQGGIMLICCGIFAMFLLFKENSNLETKDYTKICLTLLLLMLGIALIYAILNKGVQFVFNIEKSEYLFSIIGGEEQPLFSKVLHTVLYFYNLLLSDCMPLNKLVKMVVAKVARTGMRAAENNVSPSLTANFIYAPASIVFYIQIFKNKKKSFLYIMSAISIILCVIVLPVLGGGSAPLRSQYCLPFSFSFILMYVANSLSYFKRQIVFYTCFLLFAFCSAKQTLLSSMLNYSDVMRYKSDCRLASEITERIGNVSASTEIPVFFYGVHHPQFSNNYIKGEICGYSPFEWVTDKSFFDCTVRAVVFLKSQGYNYLPVKDKSVAQKARMEAENMPDFPAQGCVKNLGDVIVVRLSETLYKAE